MKVCDRYGNELRDGDTVAWQIPNTPGLVGKIVSLDTGASRLVEMHKGKRDNEPIGKLVVAVEIPFKADHDKPNVMFGDFIRTFHPASDRSIEDSLVTQ